jgi:hypothetical protein
MELPEWRKGENNNRNDTNNDGDGDGDGGESMASVTVPRKGGLFICALLVGAFFSSL